MRLDEALSGVTHLGVDTAPIIYLIEAHPKYDRLMTEVFGHIERGTLTGVTSVITLSEVLTQPFKTGNTELQQEYADLLLHSDHFQTVNLNSEMAELAAELRARYNLRIPDALQISAALFTGCEAFLTNDIVLKRVNELRILLLDDLFIPEAPSRSDETIS